MRLLLDQGLVRQAATSLCDQGFDALHVLDAGLDRAEDVEILEFARNDSRVCITLDHDFHANLALTGSGGPSVVLLRVEGLNASEQTALIKTICHQCQTALREGAAVSADTETIRVRRLPLR